MFPSAVFDVEPPITTARIGAMAIDCETRGHAHGAR
jgi:hypothetical protein